MSDLSVPNMLLLDQTAYIWYQVHNYVERIEDLGWQIVNSTVSVSIKICTEFHSLD